MDSRREFIKKAGIVAGGVGLSGGLMASVQRAFAIDPSPGSTYMDAEHIVILMQENRSFDHCYGSLQGVRGFNDPRAMMQPSGNKVWLQQNAAGETYAPFRLNIIDTKSTWMGSLPHSRLSQIDARNNGRYDKWLIAKAPRNKAYADAPLTMGYYNRQDLPFYYALADAFTICDQNFCSSLTGTTPNRLYLFTGNVRHEKSAAAHACLTNADVQYDSEVSWKTFPERLEENSISWKIYQNELSVPTGLSQEEDSWLSNFGDNPLEWFTQYNVRFSKGYRDYLQNLAVVLPDEIRSLEASIDKASAEERTSAEKELLKKRTLLDKVNKEKDIWTEANYHKLSPLDKRLHERAFTINSADPFYRTLETFTYRDGDTESTITHPKGDILHQFRKDVQQNTLPAVSWLVAPENFSDHPDAPWYGSWYVSEAMDILTHNPEVWKKTIFILCYDENDGYFDHVPPFVPNNPDVPGTGACSAGLDAALEHVTDENNKAKPRKDASAGPIGLGYRVPLVIASPWSRGGAVCSQVFDHTSILQLMEKIFSAKTGRVIREDNLTPWRRAVCGDLSAVFQTYDNKNLPLKFFVEQKEVLESVHKARFKKDPAGYKALTPALADEINQTAGRSSLMEGQEKGIRAARPLPYELYADGNLNDAHTAFGITLKSANEVFGSASAGCPFVVYALGSHVALNPGKKVAYETGRNWNYAVSPGDALLEQWPLAGFENGAYHLALHGPNGFYRAFEGDINDPEIRVVVAYERSRLNYKRPTGNVLLTITNSSRKAQQLLVKDNAYRNADIRAVSPAAGASGSEIVIKLNLEKSHGWYDFTITVNGNDRYKKRYAGHVETGSASFTDPYMGGV